MDSVKTSKFEKFAYALGDAGSNFVWTFASSFLTLYYTDSVLMAAGAVGTMMLVTRILDGVSDILFGMLMERTNTKLGKARPWFGASIIPLVVSFLLLFNVPDLSGGSKTVYVVITYFLMTVVLYTINNLSYHAMLSRISLDSDDRNTISAVRSIIVSIAALLISVGTTMLLSAFGGEKQQHAWTIVSIIYGGICLLTQAVCFLAVKEKIPMSGQAEEKASACMKNSVVKEGFKALFHTKYFYVAVSIFILSYISTGTITGAAVYYARDVLGDSNCYALLAIAFIVPGIAAQVFVPALAKRTGKRKLLIYSSLIGIISLLSGVLFPDKLAPVLVVLVITSIAGAPYSALMFTFAPDIVDYIEKRTGKRYEGLVTSANSFGIKVGTGIGSACVGWVLAWGQYNGNLEVQPHSALVAEMALIFAVPTVVGILKLICTCFWDIEK